MFLLEVCEIGSGREHEISAGSGRIPENFKILEFIGILERIGIPERVEIQERSGNKNK